MSNALDRGELASRIARGHAVGCASCQAFGRALGSLHADLSGGAHTAPRPTALVRRARRPLFVAGSLAVGAAAAVVIAISATDRPVTPTATVSPVAISDSLGRVRGVADRFSEALANTPLDTELDALIQDGRRGFDAILASGGLRPTP
jgi:hypothetical protein